MPYIRSRRIFLTILTILSLVLLAHLIGVYLYQGGKVVGQVGGSIKIGLVGKSPVIPNPLEYDLGSIYNDMILRFLFRSLIHYNTITGQYEGSLANCDIRNLSDVTCTLKDGALWSDGTAMNTTDILATYQSFKKRKDILPTYTSLAVSTSTQKIESLFDMLEVTATGKTIHFTAKDKNASMIDILTYPIIRSDMLDRIQMGRLSEDNYITSGNYSYSSHDSDTQYGFERITLKRKENVKESFIDTYQFRFFQDTASMKKNEDALNIIIPAKMTDSAPDSPRFARHTYHMFEYVALFANTDRLKGEMRTALLGNIGKTSLVEGINPLYEPINTIFFTGSSMIPTVNNNSGGIATTLARMGYFRKDELLRELDKKPLMITGTITDYGKNNSFQGPTTSKIYFASGGENEIRLSGKVKPGVTGVRINDYTLKEFDPTGTDFAYRVSQDAGTLKDGINTYSLSFLYDDGSVKPQETITIYHFLDPEKQRIAREELDRGLMAEKNTPALVAERKAQIDAERQKIDSLDAGYFYSAKKERYSLSLVFLDTPDITTIAKEVQKRASELGIHLIITPLDSKSIATMMKDGKEQYDLIIVGFEAPDRISNIAPVFSSTNAKTGINFSNIEDKKLDDLLQTLRTVTTESEEQATERSITEIIQKQAIMIPLYSVNRFFYYDKNILHSNFPTILPSLTSLPFSLYNSYIKSEFAFDWESKSFFGFFQWMYQEAVGK